MADFGFIPKKEEYGNATNEDVQYARQLIEALQIKRRLMRKPSIKAWAKQFQLLCEADGCDHQRIKRVFDWYCLNIGKEYIPQAYSAKSFRERFIKIEDAMKRIVKDEVSISDEANKVCSAILHKHWPKGSKDQVAKTVQLSLNEHKRLIELIHNVPANDYQRPFGAWLIQRIGNGPNFVESWMRQINASLQTWKLWQGDLTKLAFKMDSKRFNTIGRQYAQTYCQNPKRWDDLINTLTKGH